MHLRITCSGLTPFHTNVGLGVLHTCLLGEQVSLGGTKESSSPKPGQGKAPGVVPKCGMRVRPHLSWGWPLALSGWVLPPLHWMEFSMAAAPLSIRRKFPRSLPGALPPNSQLSLSHPSAPPDPGFFPSPGKKCHHDFPVPFGASDEVTLAGPRGWSPILPVPRSFLNPLCLWTHITCSLVHVEGQLDTTC